MPKGEPVMVMRLASDADGAADCAPVGDAMEPPTAANPRVAPRNKERTSARVIARAPPALRAVDAPRARGRAGPRGSSRDVPNGGRRPDRESMRARRAAWLADTPSRAG